MLKRKRCYKTAHSRPCGNLAFSSPSAPQGLLFNVNSFIYWALIVAIIGRPFQMIQGGPFGIKLITVDVGGLLGSVRG
jgi:hypothetical protein